MALFLGVDGGQSSTVALVADENGRVLGWGRGGPCNHAAAGEGRDKFTRAITECLSGACLQAGLDLAQVEFEAACLGFSGGVDDKEEFSRETVRAGLLKITHDAEIALTGATGGKAGVVVIAGTGSIGFGKDGNGRVFRAGGWGYIFGDEGGAFDIVRQALRAELAMEEGWGPKTILLERTLEGRASSANQLMHEWYQRFDRMKIAELAPLVDAAAADGDSVAREIMQRAGIKLATLGAAVRRELFRTDEPVTVSYVGGVFESTFLTESFRRELEAMGLQTAKPIYPPVVGALLEALKLGGRAAAISNVPVIKS